MSPLATFMMRVARNREGLYSPTSATTFGMMPPRPKPAQKRSASNSFKLVTREVASVKPGKYERRCDQDRSATNSICQHAEEQ